MKFYIENLKQFSRQQAYALPTFRFHADAEPGHSLVFCHSGAVDYDFGYWKTRHIPGEALIIPEGTSFVATKASLEESMYTVFYFQADLSITQATKLSFEKDSTMIYSILDQCITIGMKEDRYLLLSYFYKIIALLAQDEDSSVHSENLATLILPALDVMRKNLYNPSLKIGQLHTFCGISDAYFRSIFITRYGVPPKKYITEQRLLYAKQLLEYGECRSVNEAARLSGFEDPLYFSRVFKAKYGYSPSSAILK